MARYPNLVSGYDEGGAVGAETQLIAPVGVGVPDKIRITDFAVAGDAAAWFWLSMSPAGVFGHFSSLYLPAAGTMIASLESPIEINGPTSIYCHYDTAGAGTLFTACWTSEMFI